MRLTLDIELKLNIDFDAVKPERMTRDYPGDPGYAEINSISIYDIELPKSLFYKILAEHGEELLEACQDEIKESEHEDAIASHEDKVSEIIRRALSQYLEGDELEFVKNNINRQTGLKI